MRILLQRIAAFMHGMMRQINRFWAVYFYVNHDPYDQVIGILSKKGMGLLKAGLSLKLPLYMSRAGYRSFLEVNVQSQTVIPLYHLQKMWGTPFLRRRKLVAMAAGARQGPKIKPGRSTAVKTLIQRRQSTILGISQCGSTSLRIRRC